MDISKKDPKKILYGDVEIEMKEALFGNAIDVLPQVTKLYSAYEQLTSGDGNLDLEKLVIENYDSIIPVISKLVNVDAETIRSISLSDSIDLVADVINYNLVFFQKIIKNAKTTEN